MEYDDTLRSTPLRNARWFRKGNFPAGQRGICRAATKDKRP